MITNLPETESVISPREERVRQRAHEIYMARGSQPGSDLEDWLQAEAELRAQEREEPKPNRRRR